MKCSGTVEHALVVSTKTDTFCRISWLRSAEEGDKIRSVNDQLPKLPEIDVVPSKLRKSMVDVLLVEDYMLCLEDKTKLSIPDAIYLQDQRADAHVRHGVLSAQVRDVQRGGQEGSGDDPRLVPQGNLPVRRGSPAAQNICCSWRRARTEIMEELFGESSEEESSEYRPDSDDELDDDHEIEDSSSRTRNRGTEELEELSEEPSSKREKFKL